MNLNEEFTHLSALESTANTKSLLQTCQFSLSLSLALEQLRLVSI